MELIHIQDRLHAKHAILDITYIKIKMDVIFANLEIIQIKEILNVLNVLTVLTLVILAHRYVIIVQQEDIHIKIK